MLGVYPLSNEITRELSLLTVTIQSLPARPLAKLLGVDEPPEFVFLILAAHSVARMIA